jgi:hypothetical protein
MPLLRRRGRGWQVQFEPQPCESEITWLIVGQGFPGPSRLECSENRDPKSPSVRLMVYRYLR